MLFGMTSKDFNAYVKSLGMQVMSATMALGKQATMAVSGRRRVGCKRSRTRVMGLEVYRMKQERQSIPIKRRAIYE